MKQILNVILGILVIGALTGTALAVDVNTLDRVSVLMTRNEVISLLGQPDEVADVGKGLKAEVYKVDGLEPMVGTGCIYENDQLLTGQTFVFKGEMGHDAAKRLKQFGFAVLENASGSYRLLGKDDDTGHPLVAYIAHDKNMTVIMTFEKDFYDRQVK